jgi:hypothetical protein
MDFTRIKRSADHGHPVATMLWTARLQRIDRFIRAHKLGTVFSIDHIQRCVARYKRIVDHVVNDGGRWGMLRRTQHIGRPGGGRMAKPNVVVDALRLVAHRPGPIIYILSYIDDGTCCGNSIWWNWIPLQDNATTSAPVGTLARLQAKLRPDSSDIIRDFS